MTGMRKEPAGLLRARNINLDVGDSQPRDDQQWPFLNPDLVDIL